MKIGQCCAIRIRIKMCKISTLFEIADMEILACETCRKITILDPGPTLGPTYLIIVRQIQVNLFST